MTKWTSASIMALSPNPTTHTDTHTHTQTYIFLKTQDNEDGKWERKQTNKLKAMSW